MRENKVVYGLFSLNSEKEVGILWRKDMQK